jgi:hypothetical protein
LILHFLPHFPGALKSEGFCFQGERLHSGRDPNESEGGTGKAEDAKPPDAGISPKQCPGKGVAEKWMAYKSGKIQLWSRTIGATGAGIEDWHAQGMQREARGVGRAASGLRESPRVRWRGKEDRPRAIMAGISYL